MILEPASSEAVAIALERGSDPAPASMAQLPGPTGRPCTRSAWRAWLALASACVLASGCSILQTKPESPATPQAQLPVTPPLPVPPQGQPLPACEPCRALEAEHARLQRRLAERESELTDLRQQLAERERAVQTAERQVARATRRLKRLATRATAASFIAEVEVAMATARSDAPEGPTPQGLVRAQELLDASRRAFAAGDHDTAIDRASEASDLIVVAMKAPESAGPADTGRAVRHFAAARPLRVRVDSNLRMGPSSEAGVRGVLRAGTALQGLAQRGNWIRVETVDGRTGWIYGRLLEPG